MAKSITYTSCFLKNDHMCPLVSNFVTKMLDFMMWFCHFIVQAWWCDFALSSIKKTIYNQGNWLTIEIYVFYWWYDLILLLLNATTYNLDLIKKYLHFRTLCYNWSFFLLINHIVEFDTSSNLKEWNDMNKFNRVMKN